MQAPKELSEAELPHSSINPLDRDVDQVPAEERGGIPLYTLQDAFRVGMVARYGNRRYSRSLPGLLAIDLRNRDVKPVAKPVFEAFDNVPLVFERLGLLDAQLERYHADSGHGCLQLGGDLLHPERLDDVALFDVVVADERDTALEAGFHFAYVVLEALQRIDATRVNHDVVA